MESIEIPQKPEVTVSSLTQSTIESVKLCKSEGLNPIAGYALVGMKAAFPDRFSNAQLREAGNLEFFGAMIWVGVEVNDAVDIIPYAREQNNKESQEKIEGIFKSWKRALRYSKNTVGESSFRESLLEGYQREILFCEKTAREFVDSSPDEIIEYRQLMNAISVVNNAAALFGESELTDRVQKIQKSDLTWDKLLSKYSWIIKGETNNSVEEKLCGLYNLAMGVQVIDDQYDIKHDTELGLKTLATALPNSSELANTYFIKTEKYGFTKSAWQGSQLTFRAMKQLQRRFPKVFGGRRERLLSETKDMLEKNLQA